MWLAGLRGAMAYALALKSTFDFETGPIMLIATLIYAFLSILGVGFFCPGAPVPMKEHKKRCNSIERERERFPF